MPTKVATPRIDKLCVQRFEPMCGLIWADDVRPIERELRTLKIKLKRWERVRARRSAPSHYSPGNKK